MNDKLLFGQLWVKSVDQLSNGAISTAASTIV